MLQAITAGMWLKTTIMPTPTSPVRESSLQNTLGPEH